MDRNIVLDEDVEGMARGSFDPNMGLEQFQSRPIHREVPVVTPSPVPVVVPQPLIRTPPTMMEDDGEESDGLNEFGLPRNPPRTPPGPPPADQPTASGFLHFPQEDLDDVSDDGDSTPRRTGPKTPPEPAPPTPPHIKLARELESDGELSEEDTDDSSQPGTRKMRRGGRRPRSSQQSPPKVSSQPKTPPKPRLPQPSPIRRHLQRDVRRIHRTPNRQEPEKKTIVIRGDVSKELTYPTLATQKCLSLLEFVEKRGLTITDDELVSVVQDAIELDRAMDKILGKKEEMKKQLEAMADWEFQKIKRIHANMPRHMQDVLKFDGKTVHVQERAAMPPMPFGASPFMSLKYGPPMHHMGMPPTGLPPSIPPPPMGMPPPPMGMPPPPSMGMGGPPFGMPPPMSLLGPPPFGAPMGPPPGNAPGMGHPAAAGPPQHGPPRQDMDPRGPHGLNPLAFTAPAAQKPPSMNEYNTPPPSKMQQSVHNPPMAHITNNLSSMLTNALKAQVSQTQSSYGTPNATPTKKPVVPSLMSITIPGVPKAGPSGSQN
ncbi:unnamed protein product [Caenorhabditis brenneri]